MLAAEVRMRHLPLIAPLWLLACGQDLSLTTSAKCDGLQSHDEKTVDAPFDADGDGFFDGRNPGCAATYDAQYLDCEDLLPDVHPGATELVCDGVDQDCDPLTIDDPDMDGDTVGACTDCDDTNPAISPAQTEITCNLIDDDCVPETLDGSDDIDGDGFNACEDCDDNNTAINPGEGERDCNGVDDDCNAATPDGDDLDQDGVIECDDCDDTTDQAYPGLDEVCDDSIDNNCNGDVDENCTIDYTDTWYMTSVVSYSCTFGLVSINLSNFTVIDHNPSITFAAQGNQPGNMVGTLTNNVDFDVSNVLAGSCTETYELVGSFTDPNNFTGTFTARFSGGRNCYDCTDQSWVISGSR